MTRLQKLLAGLGLGSRRTVEEWIRAGRITVNGRIAQLGDRAGPGDTVSLDGRRLELGAAAPEAEVLLYNKPLGEVTTRFDPQGRPTVFERLPPPRSGRWINVGRLDVNTAGLLLMTTDGELAHRLMHPSSEIEREYLVRLRGRPGPEALQRARAGVVLEDGPAQFDRVTPVEEPGADGSHSHYRVVLHEGRNREVRRLWNALGFEVSRLTRIRYGPVTLPPELRAGAMRMLTPAEVESLRRAGRPHPGSAPGGPRPGAGPPEGRRRRGPASK